MGRLQPTTVDNEQEEERGHAHNFSSPNQSQDSLATGIEAKAEAGGEKSLEVFLTKGMPVTWPFGAIYSSVDDHTVSCLMDVQPRRLPAETKTATIDDCPYTCSNNRCCASGRTRRQRDEPGKKKMMWQPTRKNGNRGIWSRFFRLLF
jgi:hypothetical protein